MSERVPEGWEVYALGELGRVVGGGTPASETPSYWGGAVMWATPAEITKLKTRYISNTSRTITEEGLQSSSAKLHPKGTILLTSRATIGYPAINIVPMATNQGFQSLIPNEKLDVEYGYQLLLNNRGGLEKLSAGSTFLEISSNEIKKYKLPLPPLPEQKKIASILTSVDDVIETTQRQIDKLQDLKKATMNELLTKGIGHTEFKDSELGRIPKSWEVVELLKCVDRIVDCEHKTAPEIEYSEFFVVSTNAVRDGELVEENLYNTSKEAFDQWTARAIPAEGDVMFTREAPAGESCCVPKEKNVCLGQRMVLLRPNSKILNGGFLNYFLSSDTGRNSVYQMSLGTTVSRINMADINKLHVPLPLPSEQKQIAEVINGFDEKITQQKLKMKKFNSLKRSLMQDLLTGRVRVQVN